jgi:hypothetical protein
MIHASTSPTNTENHVLTQSSHIIQVENLRSVTPTHQQTIMVCISPSKCSRNPTHFPPAARQISILVSDTMCSLLWSMEENKRARQIRPGGGSCSLGPSGPGALRQGLSIFCPIFSDGYFLYTATPTHTYPILLRTPPQSLTKIFPSVVIW